MIQTYYMCNQTKIIYIYTYTFIVDFTYSDRYIYIYTYLHDYICEYDHTHIFESIYAFTYNTHTCFCTHLRVCIGAARLCGSSGL